MTLLTVERLGKAFTTYASEWQRVAGWVGFPVQPVSRQWALRNVSFTVGPGEAVGIAGQNGAGKSTLLKIVTGTMLPSEGTVALSGRVAAILELGLGFNPNLTGRENAAYSSSLLGLTPREIDANMDYMEAFAEIGGYFDEPMRTYSSGMQMRVAFAVVTAVRPDLLIVDEALAVGDAYFQHKCMARIREFREAGTSLLIVSHDRGAIQGLCDRAILLEAGEVVRDGDPESVMDFYNAIIAEKEAARIVQQETAGGRIQTVSGTGAATVSEIALLNEAGERVEHLTTGQRVRMRIDVRIRDDIETLVLGYGIKDRLGQVVFGTNTWHTHQVIQNATAGETYRFDIAFDANLGVGSYSIQTALCDRDTHHVNNYEWRDLALVFNVSNPARDFFIGTAWIAPDIDVERLG